MASSPQDGGPAGAPPSPSPSPSPPCSRSASATARPHVPRWLLHYNRRLLLQEPGLLRRVGGRLRGQLPLPARVPAWLAWLLGGRVPRLINSLTSIKTLRSMLTKILAHIAVFVDQLVFFSILLCCGVLMMAMSWKRRVRVLGQRAGHWPPPHPQVMSCQGEVDRGWLKVA